MVEIQSTNEYYENVIHSLTHSHLKDNHDRHFVVLEKWCLTYTDGLFIKDMKYVKEIFSIVKDKILTQSEFYLPLLPKILTMCSKPLLESKSNERLRPQGIENVQTFYYSLFEFLNEGSVATKLQCASVIKSIVQGYKKEFIFEDESDKSPTGRLCAQIVDQQYIQDSILQSSALTVLSSTIDKTIKHYSTLRENMRLYIEEQKLAQKMKNRKIKPRSSSNDSKDVESDEEPTDNTAGDEMSLNSGQSLGGSQADKMAISDANELTKSLIQLCLELSANQTIAVTLCSLGVCDSVFLMLHEESFDTGPKSERVGECLEILWNCIEAYVKFCDNSSGEGDIEQLSHESLMDYDFALRVLKTLLQDLMFKGYKQSDKESRNEIVIILSLLLNIPSSLPYFLSTGILNDIVTYACIGDGGKRSWAFFTLPLPNLRNFFTLSDIDMQLKKELWLLVSELAMKDDEDILLCIASSPMMTVLFAYLTYVSGGNNDDPLSVTDQNQLAIMMDHNEVDPNDYSIEKKHDINEFISSIPIPLLRELQLLAALILAQTSYRMISEFLRVKGPEKCLFVLNTYALSTVHEHLAVVYNIFLLITRCINSSDIVIHRLEQINAIKVFLHFFECNENENTRSQAARTIAVMTTKSDESKRQLLIFQGIHLLVLCLAKSAKNSKPSVGKKANISFQVMGTQSSTSTGDYDSNGEELSVLVISVLDCIWKGVVGNLTNEIQFAHDEGVDALLAMLEVCPFLVRPMVLRILSDLFENRRLSSFALSWRSDKTMRSVGQLLAHSWLDEEVRLMSVRDESGVLANLWFALGNHQWPAFVHEGLLEDASPTDVATTEKNSALVLKLNNAILAARDSNTNKTLRYVRAKAVGFDVRGIIASSLDSLGFFEQPVVKVSVNEPISNLARELSHQSSDRTNNILNLISEQELSASDKQVLSIACRYDTLRESMWWESILEELHNENIELVTADRNFIEDRKELSFQTARLIQFEQMELGVADLDERKEKEGHFFDHILQQKNQQIKSEWLKRKSAFHRVSTTKQGS